MKRGAPAALVRVGLSLDGRPLSAYAGESVAVAIARAGGSFRRSVSGEARAPVCGMGICHECRVEIDGVPHQLACMTPCAEGMDVRGGANVGQTGKSVWCPQLSCEVLVVGGGPAGLAAAAAAHAAGKDVLLLEERHALGGNIGRKPELAVPFRVRTGTRVVAAVTGAPDGALGGALLAESAAAALEIRYRSVVVATGARELLLPFPGWTLPGVTGVGGLQLLAKGGWPVAGKRVLIGGTGPLLLAAAAELRRRGAVIAGVAELAPASRLARLALSLVRFPAKLAQGAALSASLFGVPVWTGAFVCRADGEGQVRSAVVDVRGRRRTVACDLLAVGFGLVPSVELASLLGCAIESGAVRADELGRTSVANVFCAGEVGGIGGDGKATVEGTIAGLCAAGRESEARKRLAQQRGQRAFARALALSYPPPAGWERVLESDTIVCRCEDVRWGALRDARDFRSAKLHTRVGMGACQGRVCGSALSVLKGFAGGAAHPPLAPARLDTLTR